MSENIKTQVRQTILFSGLKRGKTTKDENKNSIYTLNDTTNGETTITIKLWKYENENAISIEHNGLDKLSQTDTNRYNRMVEKLKKIEGVIFSEEDLNQPVFTPEQEEILDKIIEEGETTLEGETSEEQ